MKERGTNMLEHNFAIKTSPESQVGRSHDFLARFCSKLLDNGMKRAQEWIQDGGNAVGQVGPLLGISSEGQPVTYPNCMSFLTYAAVFRIEHASQAEQHDSPQDYLVELFDVDRRRLRTATSYMNGGTARLTKEGRATTSSTSLPCTA